MATRGARLVHMECEYLVVDVADNSTTVFNGPCILYSIYVNTVLSAHALPIEDDTTAIYTLIASAAAGTNILFPGTRFLTSMVVNPDDAATGNITISFRKVNTD